ncbi:MAG: PEP-CTERM sorting domain-containing protein [Gammaproteobacteria bacterium]
MQLKFVLLFITTLLYSAISQAITVTDRWPGDSNTITAVIEDTTSSILTISEDYAEDELIRYSSYSGYAVIETDPGMPIQFFDKVFRFDTSITGRWQMTFDITNSTPWNWSGYHFEFWDTTFNNSLDIGGIVLGQANNVLFQQMTINGNSADFLGGDKHEKGATYSYALGLDFDVLSQRGIDSFGIRQVATVPEPSSLFLLAIGAIGLALSRKPTASSV